MPRKLIIAGLTVASVAAAAVAANAAPPLAMGTPKTTGQPSFQGYYDGHLDTYLSTDISSKTEAKAMHINYSATIGKVKGLPEIYLVQGRAAAGQLAVFGSEPGKPTTHPSGRKRSSAGSPARPRC